MARDSQVFRIFQYSGQKILQGSRENSWTRIEMSLSPRDLPKKRKNNIRAKILRMKVIENGEISMML